MLIGMSGGLNTGHRPSACWSLRLTCPSPVTAFRCCASVCMLMSALIVRPQSRSQALAHQTEGGQGELFKADGEVVSKPGIARSMHKYFMKAQHVHSATGDAIPWPSQSVVGLGVCHHASSL